MTTSDARVTKWVESLERTRTDVVTLHYHRRNWRELRPALAAASERSGTLLNHYTQLYLYAHVSGLRRLADEGRRTASLVRLMSDIAQHPRELNRARYVSLTRERDPSLSRYEEERLAEEFDVWTDAGSDHVSSSKVRHDRTHFSATVANAVEFANNVIAHTTNGVIQLSLTWGDIDAGIDEAGLLYRRYTALLCAAHVANLEPDIHGDWLRPLRDPLLRPDHPVPGSPEILPSIQGWP